MKRRKQVQGSEEDARIMAEVMSVCHWHTNRLWKENKIRKAEEKDGKKKRLTTLSSDPATQDLVEGMKGINMPTLVLGVQSDDSFPCVAAKRNRRMSSCCWQ